MFPLNNSVRQRLSVVQNIWHSKAHAQPSLVCLGNRRSGPPTYPSIYSYPSSLTDLKFSSLLTAIYCQPLLTRTSSASSSVMYASVPGRLSADFCVRKFKKYIYMKYIPKHIADLGWDTHTFVISSMFWKVIAPGTIFMLFMFDDDAEK